MNPQGFLHFNVLSFQIQVGFPLRKEIFFWEKREEKNPLIMWETKSKVCVLWNTYDEQDPWKQMVYLWLVLNTGQWV